jgi:hypothetical protein
LLVCARLGWLEFVVDAAAERGFAVRRNRQTIHFGCRQPNVASGIRGRS